MAFPALPMVLASLLLSGGQAREAFTFEDIAPGELPAGWKVEATNPSGPLAVWRVVEEKGTESGARVLALDEIRDGKTPTFNLLWTNGLRFKDGEIEVRIRSVSGVIDRGGGPMWRVRDKDNYYICRFNPLEENLRVYYVKEGKRHQLASAKAPAEGPPWREIRIRHVGERIECFLDGVRLLDVADSTFPDEGGIGLWTKADAVTRFDDLRLWEPPGVLVLAVKGMTCSLCEASVESALKGVAGVSAVSASYRAGWAFVRFEGAAPPSLGAINGALATIEKSATIQSTPRP